MEIVDIDTRVCTRTLKWNSNSFKAVGLGWGFFFLYKANGDKTESPKSEDCNVTSVTTRQDKRNKIIGKNEHNHLVNYIWFQVTVVC